jgi:hypothetical protein
MGIIDYFETEFENKHSGNGTDVVGLK